MESGKRIEMIYNGKAVTILNQRSRLWTHPYDYRTPQKATLSSAFILAMRLNDWKMKPMVRRR